MSLPIKTALKQSKPTINITHDDEAKKWEISFSIIVDPIKVYELKFEVGEEFDDKMPVGSTNKGLKFNAIQICFAFLLVPKEVFDKLLGNRQ